MSKRNVVAVVVAVVALVSLAGAAALAGGPGPHGMMLGLPGARLHGGGGPLGLALHRLDLTAEQRTAIRAVLDAEQPALEALRERIRESEEAFVEAHPPTEFDEAAIRAHAAEQAPLLSDLAVAEARIRAKALALLTPEQLAELETMRSRMQERLRDRMQERAGRAGGHREF